MSYIKIDRSRIQDLQYVLGTEHIQVNDFGAYYFSTLIGLHTRKYHALFAVPQLQIDEDQQVLLSTLLETIDINDTSYELGTQKYPGVYSPKGYQHITDVSVDNVHSVTFKLDQVILLKEILMCQHQNQLLIRYTVLDSEAHVTLKLKPFLAFRNKHRLIKANPFLNSQMMSIDGGVGYKLYEIYDTLYLQVASRNQRFVSASDWYNDVEYSKERERGYEYQEDLWVPGYFEMELTKGESVIFSAGLEKINPDTLHDTFSSEVQRKLPLKTMENCLESAARQFIIKNDHSTEIIAGYPWFGRWGRDTFISLPGLALSMGNSKICKEVIDTMLCDLKNALFPNIGSGEGAAMNSVDAPLWFFWALQKCAEQENSSIAIWNTYSSYLKRILEGYRSGTEFNIKMHPNGLIYAGEKGKALTWMDALYKGEVFTPRTGFAVEINALWYNAICFSVVLAKRSGDLDFVEKWKPLISKIEVAFSKAFWDYNKGYLADVVLDDQKDWSIRPNQIFATSLPYTPLTKYQRKSILAVVERELLTPRGLRTLSPKDPKYIGTYRGNQWERDRAYHQGTVWPWLLGHFAEGYLRIYKQRGVHFVQEIYKNMEDTLHEHGLGTISEVFDGDSPHNPGGAISQAWSVSELMRIKELIKEYAVPIVA